MSGVTEVVWPADVYGSCRTVAATLLGCYIIVKVGGLVRAEWRRKKFEVAKFTSDSGVLVLHQFSRGKFCPNLSPFALKVECFLRLSNIPYVVDCAVPFGPKSKCPWVNLDGSGEAVADSQFVIDAITAREQSCLGRLPPGDAAISTRERAALEGMRCLVEEQLFWCVIYWRYSLDRCRVFLTTQRFPRLLAFGFSMFMPSAIKNKARLQGMGSHSPREVLGVARSTCRALSDFIGESDFFCGAAPGTQDCAIFGGLAQLRWNAPATHYERLLTVEFPRLGRYCDRMKDTLYPDWDALLQQPYGGGTSHTVYTGTTATQS